MGELGDTGLGDHGGAAGAVGGDGAVVAVEVGALQVAEAGGSVARAGAADGDEAEALDGAGDEFAVEAAADEDGDVAVAEAPCAGEQTSDARRRRWLAVGRVVAGNGAGVDDVFVAEGDAEAADDHARQTRDDGEGEALLEGEVGDGSSTWMSLRGALPAQRVTGSGFQLSCI